MSAVQYGLECEPGGQPTVLGPTPEPTHTGCPGGSNTPGLIGGWTCPCNCHRPVAPSVAHVWPPAYIGEAVGGPRRYGDKQAIRHAALTLRRPPQAECGVLLRDPRWSGTYWCLPPTCRKCLAALARERSQTSANVDDLPEERASHTDAHEVTS